MRLLQFSILTRYPDTSVIRPLQTIDAAALSRSALAPLRSSAPSKAHHADGNEPSPAPRASGIRHRLASWHGIPADRSASSARQTAIAPSQRLSSRRTCQRGNQRSCRPSRLDPQDRRLADRAPSAAKPHATHSALQEGYRPAAPNLAAQTISASLKPVILGGREYTP